jgi:hypothetical protein
MVGRSEKREAASSYKLGLHTGHLPLAKEKRHVNGSIDKQSTDLRNAARMGN